MQITPAAEVDWDMIMNDHGLIILRQTLDMLSPGEAGDDQILHSVRSSFPTYARVFAE